jgi:hypothetical protein
MIKKYRKKPVVIEAMQVPYPIFLGSGDSDDIFNWLLKGGAKFTFEGDDKINIGTLEGTMTARSTDFIIKGVKGEFYPCRADIFEETYEVVE